MTKKNVLYGIIFIGATCFLFIFAKHIIGEEEISSKAKMKMKRIERIKNSIREVRKYKVQYDVGEEIARDVVAKIDEVSIHNKFDEIQIASAYILSSGTSPFLFVSWVGDNALADHITIDCGGQFLSFKIPEYEIEKNKQREEFFVSYESVIYFDEVIQIPECLQTNKQVNIYLSQGSKILFSSRIAFFRRWEPSIHIR